MREGACPPLSLSGNENGIQSTRIARNYCGNLSVRYYWYLWLVSLGSQRYFRRLSYVQVGKDVNTVRIYRKLYAHTQTATTCNQRTISVVRQRPQRIRYSTVTY
jgi:hypothetical protein